YESAISVANWTKPSTVSILTGQYPHHHGLVSTCRDAVAVGNSDRTLPALLREMGYRTSAVVSNLTYGHPFGNGTYRSFDACPWDTYSPGFLDGNLFRRLRHRVRDQVSAALIDFDIYVSGWMDELLNYPGEFLNHLGASRFGQWGGVWNRASPAPAATTFARARQVLEQRTGQPQFVWVHVFPPHAPYLPESAYRGRFLPAEEFATAPSQARLVGAYAEGLQDDVDRLRLRYNEVILEADEAFADFVDFLKESGRWENTLLVVSSDHGDSFEDGMQGHKGEFLYQQLIHIPLLIHLPGQREGARIDGAVSQVDIAPTILDYLGGTVPSWMDGEALGRDLTRAGEKSYRYAMEIEANGPRQPITRGIVAVTDGRYKLVYSLTHDSVELFDLLADPDESRNIAPENGELVERMQTALIDRISNE
ncbi:MAG: sulfatase, partial [Gemmatimonadetes bacterium]|nr:sulfatase [Gemmatimonadota bacterium]